MSCEQEIVVDVDAVLPGSSLGTGGACPAVPPPLQPAIAIAPATRRARARILTRMGGRRRRLGAALAFEAAAAFLVFACSASSPLPPGGDLPGDVGGAVDAAAPDQDNDSPAGEASAPVEAGVEAGEDVVEGSVE